MRDAFIVADTSVFAYLSKPSILGHDYDALIGMRSLAISFQTEAELLSSRYSPRRQAMLDALIASVLRLPHSHDTSIQYATVAVIRQETKPHKLPGRDAGDADVWFIASAMEYGYRLVSHDRQMVALARAAGHDVYTALPTYRAENPA